MPQNNKYEYDAFISHAVEDKIPIANELCAKLERAGLKIWYSGKELGIGDSIEKTIEKGLNRSRYGIVIFSPTYLSKNWTIREFYTLLAKEIEEQKVILPVLYNITLDELKNKDLLMADRFAANADRGIDFVVERLVREIKKTNAPKPREAWFSKMWFCLILSLIVNAGLLLKGTVFSRSQPAVTQEQLDDVRLQSNVMNQGTLFREMQGIMQQLTTCGCNDQAPDAGPKTQTRLIKNMDQPVRAIQNPYGNERDPTKSTRKITANKMTMAVVFQIETALEIEDEMDEILNTINLDEGQDPFINIANVVPQSKHECVHAVSLSE